VGTEVAQTMQAACTRLAAFVRGELGAAPLHGPASAARARASAVPGSVLSVDV
jgi:hypothetical protein